MVTIAVRTVPTSTRNMTGLRIMFRGSSMTNDRQVAIRTIAGSKTARCRACRRWILKAWASAGGRLGSPTSVSRLMGLISVLGVRQDFPYLRLSRPRLDGDVVLRRGRRTLQARLVRLHLLGRDANPVGIGAVEAPHRRVSALPGHPQGPLPDHLPTVPHHPVPLLLQRRPAPFDRVVCAGIRGSYTRRLSNPDQS